MIIGRKEQRQACIQLLEQKTFTGTRHKKLAEKKNYTSHRHWILIFTYVPEKIFCNDLDVLCFTRVENKQKNSILICPKDFGLWVKICLWPSKRLAALSVCQVERVCALPEWMCHSCSHRFRFFLVHTWPHFVFTDAFILFWFILHLTVSTLCIKRSVWHQPFYFSVSWFCYITH